MHIFVSINWPFLMLFIPVFAKTETRHLVCRPLSSPQRWHTLAPYLPLLPASGLASSHNSSQPRGVWEWGLPVRIYYCPGSDSLILDTKTEPRKEDEGELLKKLSTRDRRH